jgi:hypothetical protein
LIPVVAHGEQVAHLVWVGDGMEAHTADGVFVGKYPTRREATIALAGVLRRRGIRRWTTRPTDAVGKMRVLAVTSSTRLIAAPEPPTTPELGFPGLTGENKHVSILQPDQAHRHKWARPIGCAIRAPASFRR